MAADKSRPVAVGSPAHLRKVAEGLRQTRFAVVTPPPPPLRGPLIVVEAKGLGELLGDMADALADARERIAVLEQKEKG